MGVFRGCRLILVGLILAQGAMTAPRSAHGQGSAANDANNLRPLGLTLSRDRPGSSGGVVIAEVDPASDAAKKGIKAGDAIFSASGTRITAPADLAAIVVQTIDGGRRILILGLRSGDLHQYVPVELRAAAPAQQTKPAPLAAGSKPATSSAQGGETARTTDSSLELLYWGSVKDSQSIDELRSYLSSFPYGIFAELARLRIKKLGGNAEAPVARALENSAKQRGLGRPERPDVASAPARAEVTPGAWLGIHLGPAAKQFVDELSLNEATGARITKVEPDSPAAIAGIRPDDIVRKFGTSEIMTPGHLKCEIGSAAVGTKANLLVVRNGREQNVSVRFEATPILQGSSRRTSSKPASKPDKHEQALACGGEGIDDAVTACTDLIAGHQLTTEELADAHRTRGVAYYHDGDHARGLADFAKALEIAPRKSLVYRSRGNAYLAEGDCDLAFKDFARAIELEANAAEGYIARGYAYRWRGMFEAAIADYTKAIELAPQDAHLFRARGETIRDKGDYVRAIADFGRALELAQSIPSNAAVLLRLRGDLNNWMGHHEAAVVDYSKLIEAERSDLHRFKRANALLRKGEVWGAIADLDKLVERRPYTVEYRVARGKAYSRIGGDARSIDDLGHASGLIGSPPPAFLIARGETYERLGRKAEALAEFEGAIASPERSWNADKLFSDFRAQDMYEKAAKSIGLPDIYYMSDPDIRKVAYEALIRLGQKPRADFLLNRYANSRSNNGRLGVRLAPRLVFPDYRSSHVEQVASDGPAAAAGIQPKDELLEIDGLKTFTGVHLTGLIRAAGAGARVNLLVRRGGETHTISVTLGTVPTPSTPPSSNQKIQSAPPLAGASQRTYRVTANVSGGNLYMRRGPGPGHALVAHVPVGATGIKRGECQKPDDKSDDDPWCRVEWGKYSGWASSCCLGAD